MADADEDAIPSSHTRAGPSTQALSTGDASPTLSAAGDSDSEGEAADFRFLSSVTPAGSRQAQGLPKRGTKDFEPNPTQSQRSTLDASRKAMHDALSAVRVHAEGKAHNIGIFVNWEKDEEKEQWSAFRGLGDFEAGSADWRKRVVVVYNFKGTHSKTVGRQDRRAWTWFLPEEALYLLERGSLDVRWPVISGEADEDVFDGERLRGGGDEELPLDEELDPEDQDLPRPPIGELPMSLQGAYASFIGKSGLTLDRYLVYAGLKRSGYVVQRAPTWDDDADSQLNGSIQNSSLFEASTTNPSDIASPPQTTLIHRLVQWIINPRRGIPNPCMGPLLAPGLYRNYNDVFRSLALIPYHTSTTSPKSSSTPKSPYTLSYLLYKPNSGYRKSAPPSPNYRVCIVDARATNVPTMSQIGGLLDTMPEDELKGEGRRIEAKIKHGRRNVLVAVVDGGVVSYLRFSESEIGRYRLYEEKGRKGTKGRGGGQRGRGRGGTSAGRGRGGKS